MNFRFNVLFLIVLVTCLFTRAALAQSPVYLTAVNDQPRHTTNVIGAEMNANTILSNAQQRKQLIEYLKEAEAGNPGITGQSLLEDKFDNTDTGDRKNLLITNRN